MIRCELCPGSNACVQASGPIDCDRAFIGEAPGKDENKKGIPFIGKTGREVNEHYLPLAGLSRDNEYFDNAIRCLPVSSDGRLDINRQKDLDLLLSCASNHLYPALEAMNPKLIIPMGGFANRAFSDNIDLDLHHGMPMPSPFGMTFPMWHPAGGVHEPKKMLQIRTDWVRLRMYLRGKLSIAKDPYEYPDYEEITDLNELDLIDPTMPMGCDTESSRSKGPYFLTFSQLPGTARLIRANRKDLLDKLQDILYAFTAPIIFHNWMYDFHIVTQMGLYFPNHLIKDSMIRAYHLGNLPQGLKVLAYRLLGMKMQDFEDLVKPYSTKHVLDYYKEGFYRDWPKPEPQLKRKGELWKVYKPQSMSTKFKRFFTDYMRSPDTKDVFKAWENWEDSQAEIEEELGPYPGMDIAHVPFHLAKYYACRDADATIRLWDLLENIKLKAMQGGPQESWV